jgi:hypothetical protein
MTDLSPAQKAVAAFDERHELCGPFDDDWVEQCLAAALEAVADQVVPETVTPWNSSLTPLTSTKDVRRKLLAIAAELRGTTAPTETP